MTSASREVKCESEVGWAAWGGGSIEQSTFCILLYPAAVYDPKMYQIASQKGRFGPG